MELTPEEAVRWQVQFPEPYRGNAGRGVLIPAGGPYLVGAFVIIGLLRRLGCDLPVEIWHQGPAELTWVADAIRRRFSGVSFCYIGRPGGPREQGGWQLKAEALARSRFRECLMLDADNEPLQDPAALFGDPGYLESGTLFWQSPVDSIAADNPAWRRVGLEPRELPGLDSAQIVVDQAKAWPAVALAAYLNRRSETYWRGLWGDKDTFQLAWLRAGRPYSLIDRRPELVGGSIYHGDRRGRPCFRHRFNEKWSIKEPVKDWDNSPAAELLHELRETESAMHAGNRTGQAHG